MSLLAKVTKGVVKKPHYLLMHGVPGIGKSTFAAEAPNPIFLCAEKGTNHLDVTRLELNSYDEFMGALKELFEQPHDYKTVVIDTIDHLEPLIQRQVGTDEGKAFEKIGYNKGPEYALAYWQNLITGLELLRDVKNMNVIILAHTEVKRFNDPQLTEGYDRYQVKLHHKAAGLLIDRVEDVLFVNYKAFVVSKAGEKTKALGDGTRVIYTENRPAFQAKNRFSLPFEMPLDWEDYVAGKGIQQVKSPTDLMENIKSLLGEVKDLNMKKKIEEHLAKVKDSPLELSKVETKLKTIVSAA